MVGSWSVELHKTSIQQCFDSLGPYIESNYKLGPQIFLSHVASGRMGL